MSATSAGFEVETVADPDPVPYQRFLAVMEDLHAAVGTSIFLSENSRNLLLGRIEGYLRDEAAYELPAYQEKRRNLCYSLDRARGQAARMDIGVEEAYEKCRRELTLLVKRPGKGAK